MQTWGHPLHHFGSSPSIKTPILASDINFSFSRCSIRRNFALQGGKVRLKSARNEANSTERSQISDSEGASSENTRSASTSFLSVLCPLLKFFGVATSSLSSVVRFPWGSRSVNGTKNSRESIGNPPRLQLYEFEACPFCRRVREAMTELDLSAEVYPCPKGSRRYREIVQKTGGKEQFPFLVDLNNGVSMYESDKCERMFYNLFVPVSNSLGGHCKVLVPTVWSRNFSIIWSFGEHTIYWMGAYTSSSWQGMTLWDRAVSEPPLKMIELFSFENNPYARIVRETLCELELLYVLYNVGEGSANTELLLKASGSKELPYLVDSNTGDQMGDYKKIISYLFQTYSYS